MQPDTFEPPLTPAVFVILLALSSGARHQYGILAQVEHDSGGVVHISPGTVPHVLKRLVHAGLVDAIARRRDLVLDGPPRVYYQLTTFGRQALAAELARYQSLVALGYRRALLAQR